MGRVGPTGPRCSRTAYVDAVTAAGGAAGAAARRLDAAEAARGRRRPVLTGGVDVDPRATAGPRTAPSATAPTATAGSTALLAGALRARPARARASAAGSSCSTWPSAARLHQHVPDVVGHEGHRPAPGTYGSTRRDAVSAGHAPRRRSSATTPPCPATTTRPSPWSPTGSRCRRSPMTASIEARRGARPPLRSSACSGTPRGRLRPRLFEACRSVRRQRTTAHDDVINPATEAVVADGRGRPRSRPSTPRSRAPSAAFDGLACGGPGRPGAAAAPLRRGRRRRPRGAGRARGGQRRPHHRQRPLGGGQRPRRPRLLRRRAGAALRPADPGGRRRRRHLPRAARRRRRDRAVELPDADRRLGLRAGPGGRQHASCSSRPSSPRSPRCGWASSRSRPGIPADVFQVLPGKGTVVGERFVDHPAVRKVGFTGSTEVGQARSWPAAPSRSSG